MIMDKNKTTTTLKVIGKAIEVAVTVLNDDKKKN